MSFLAPVESRFPLSHGRVPAAEDDPADEAVAPGRRRFGLRFFVPDGPPAEPAFAHCEHRQVTVDGDGRPVVHGPRAGWEQTSTGNMDGNEETKMDRDPDSA